MGKLIERVGKGGVRRFAADHHVRRASFNIVVITSLIIMAVSAGYLIVRGGWHRSEERAAPQSRPADATKSQSPRG